MTERKRPSIPTLVTRAVGIGQSGADREYRLLGAMTLSPIPNFANSFDVGGVCENNPDDPATGTRQRAAKPAPVANLT